MSLQLTRFVKFWRSLRQVSQEVSQSVPRVSQMRHMCPKGVSSVSDETHVSHAVPNLNCHHLPTRQKADEMRLIEGAASLHGVVVGARGLIVDLCIDAV